jgi:RecB family exonuclease
MGSHKLSMSGIDLAMLCSHGFRADAPSQPRPPGIEARVGTATHALVEAAIKGQQISVDDDVAEKASRIATQLLLWLRSRPRRELRSEMGLRYDAEHDSATEGASRGPDGYADIGPMTIPGTLDLAWRDDNGTLVVVDIKTGKKEHAHEWQIIAQGLAYARLMGEERVRIGFVFPRLTKCDEPELRELSSRDLDLSAGHLHDLMRHLPVAQPRPGDWCWRCSARPNCPAAKETTWKA